MHEELFLELQNKGKLDGDLFRRFASTFGDVFYKALEFLQKNGPKIYKNLFYPSGLEIWTIQGKKHQYLVYPETACQCHYFTIQIVYKTKKFGYCKHLLAQKIAYILGMYQEIPYQDINWEDWFENFSWVFEK